MLLSGSTAATRLRRLLQPFNKQKTRKRIDIIHHALNRLPERRHPLRQCVAPPLHAINHSMETIIKRYQNFPEAQKRAHGRRLLKERSKDFQVPLVTTDRKPNIYDVTIDESSISQLTIEQLTQIERKLEYALRNAKTRKLEAYSIATLHEKGKATLEERDLMEMVSRKEQASGLIHRN
ncbi:hypothetical protein ZWY2020_047376 [Hordeum vulgare]|nr:hypothetical protein ZWY2020_047376 [Hordeum vulgare]